MRWKDIAPALAEIALRHDFTCEVSPYGRGKGRVQLTMKAVSESALHELAHARLLCIYGDNVSDRISRAINEMDDEEADEHELTACAVELVVCRTLRLRASLDKLVRYAGNSLRSFHYTEGDFSDGEWFQRSHRFVKEVLETPRTNKVARGIVKTIIGYRFFLGAHGPARRETS